MALSYKTVKKKSLPPDTDLCIKWFYGKEELLFCSVPKGSAHAQFLLRTADTFISKYEVKDPDDLVYIANVIYTFMKDGFYDVFKIRYYYFMDFNYDLLKEDNND